MNAKQKFIAQVEALKENDPLGQWYADMQQAALDAGAAIAKGYSAQRDAREGFTRCIQAQDSVLKPLRKKTARLTAGERGWNAALDWYAENPRPAVDPRPHKITLRHANGETHYTLARDNTAIDGFIKSLKRLPISRFK